jgi:high-affinity iron transporter
MFAARGRPFLAALFVALFAFAPARAAVDDTPAQLLHVLGYLAVDYPATVDHGVVRDAAEYAEQREFAGRVPQLIRALPPNPGQATLVREAGELVRLIDSRAAPAGVAALTE